MRHFEGVTHARVHSPRESTKTPCRLYGQSYPVISSSALQYQAEHEVETGGHLYGPVSQACRTRSSKDTTKTKNVSKRPAQRVLSPKKADENKSSDSSRSKFKLLWRGKPPTRKVTERRARVMAYLDPCASSSPNTSEANHESNEDLSNPHSPGRNNRVASRSSPVLPGHPCTIANSRCRRPLRRRIWPPTRAPPCQTPR